LIEFLNKDMLKGGKKQSAHGFGVGINHFIFATKRLVRMAIQHALGNGNKSVTLVHKGNIQKFTEGAFRKWGYELATEEFRDKSGNRTRELDHRQSGQESEPCAKKNAALIEPGIEIAPPEFAQVRRRRKFVRPGKIYATQGTARGRKADDQRPHCRSHLPAGGTRADEYSVLATPNSERRLHLRCLAAQVGGLGIAPGRERGRRISHV
jgi:isocitrate dehydrogenase